MEDSEDEVEVTKGVKKAKVVKKEFTLPVEKESTHEEELVTLFIITLAGVLVSMLLL